MVESYIYQQGVSIYYDNECRNKYKRNISVDKISISRIKGKEGEICTYHVLTETLSFFIEHDYNDGAHN